MFWCDQLLDGISGPQVINDSKTPSGRAHVGALRGPLIHDAIFRTLKQRGIEVIYRFGCDDYDPVDEIPYGEREHFEQYLGAPLCNVPPPPGSSATDMADHYISEFWGVFKELGVHPQFYRMREIYRSGQFDEAIDVILRHAHVVRRVYKEVSGAERPEWWHPFQVICEKCGRIGTTEVSAYDGKEVTYECRPNMVKWAQGCGYKGKTVPFGGKGKLPWKLEWCAKWKTFPVTIEGAGQDHSTKGGSRDVSMACLREIFGQKPPMNCPYDFFLVGGAKMSSSKGVGVSSRGMADFLPPEVLRFLMIRTFPKHHVNFDSSEAHIIKVFNEFDRFQHRYFADPKINDEDKRVYELASVGDHPEPDHWVADFQLVTALIQMPHLEAEKELEKRKGSPFTELDRKHLALRIRAARYWIENYATEEEKTRLQDTLPEKAQELTPSQRAFLHKLAELLPNAQWEGEALQVCIFNAARLTPLDQPSAFKAIYRVLLDRSNGPKAGNLLSFLDPKFVIPRCQELQFSTLQFWNESAISEEALEKWLQKEKPNLVENSVQARSHYMHAGAEDADQTKVEPGLEFTITLMDGKQHCRRILTKDKFLQSAPAAGTDIANEAFEQNSHRVLVQALSRRLCIKIELQEGTSRS